MNAETNITFGVAWICVGVLAGAPLALGFRDTSWLGGYASLERRLLRLAHIACIMLGLLNVVFGMLVRDARAEEQPAALAGVALIAGAVLMPLVLAVGARFRAALSALPVPFTLFAGGSLAVLWERIA